MASCVDTIVLALIKECIKDGKMAAFPLKDYIGQSLISEHADNNFMQTATLQTYNSDGSSHRGSSNPYILSTHGTCYGKILAGTQ